MAFTPEENARDIAKIERRIERHEVSCNENRKEFRSEFGKIWQKLGVMEVDQAKQSTKVALIVGIISALGSALIAFGLKFLMT